jgi:long-chain acyl-CoA synthetase
MNLVELANQHYKTFGEQVSVIFEDREYTNLQMLRFADQLANGLRGLGVKPGDKVMVMLLNCPEVLISYQGLLRAGGVIVPVLFLLGEREVAHILKNSEAVVLITSKDLLPKIEKDRPGIETLKHILVVEDEEIPGTISFWKLIRENSEIPVELEIDEYDLAVILYTSGTTGVPKGVMLSHKNLYSNAVSCASFADILPNDVGLQVLPLSHSYGLTVMNAGFMFNNKNVLLRWFDLEQTFKLIEKYKVTGFAGVPAMFAIMLNSPLAEQYDLSSLRSCGSGSAPLPLEVLRGFQDKFGCPVREGYGLSEAAPVVSAHRPDRPQKPGSIGIPIPGVAVRIVDDGDKDVPNGEIGELIVKGPNISPGYYKMPEETGKTFRNGWLYTGDMARMDEDGYLYIVERKKDLIIRGGFNIYPRDVEEVLFEHPAVLDVAVIGLPDPIMGEEVKAFVVLKSGQSVTEQEIIAHCQDRLGKYKCPKYIAFLDQLPRSPIGKVLRKELRNRS